jgi:glycosyltransferase involved in cell wall biosynthesis
MSHPTATLAATIIIPTSIDRGPTLRLAVESVLRQTVRDLEVFIIGDGVHEVTRQTALDLMQTDSRVRFFDHPKHSRRGEPYRDEALKTARGRIVCYLCDRDLYLPHHVAELVHLLADADFAHTLPLRILENGQIHYDCAYDLSHPEDRRHLEQAAFPSRKLYLPLSISAHTLDAYRRLAEGWVPTPAGLPTDLFFSSKFARDPHMKLKSGFRPTVLYFPRGNHPGLSTAERLTELSAWSRRIQSPEEVQTIEAAALTAAIIDRTGYARLLRHDVIIKGRPLETYSFYRRWRWLLRLLRISS